MLLVCFESKCEYLIHVLFLSTKVAILFKDRFNRIHVSKMLGATFFSTLLYYLETAPCVFLKRMPSKMGFHVLARPVHWLV